jgi:hypothetical protein
VYRVEKSKDCYMSGEALFITSTTPVVIENSTTNTRNICLFEFRHPKAIDCRKHSFGERTWPLRKFSKRNRAGCTNKSRFNWIFMKLPNGTKKWETKATLYTTKIMSLIKRKMRFQDIRLGKIGDHIHTNGRIKLRESRRNIEVFTNKHKIITTFIHVVTTKDRWRLFR